MSRRNQFLLLAATCVLNCVAMFYVAFGAAFGGPQRTLLWPALALLALGVLILATLSALRAGQVGHSRGLAFASVVLTAPLGPALVVPVLYLAFKPEPRADLPRVPALTASLQPLALLVLPWAVLFAFGLGRTQ